MPEMGPSICHRPLSAIESNIAAEEADLGPRRYVGDEPAPPPLDAAFPHK
jgi:hypothetical protein